MIHSLFIVNNSGWALFCFWVVLKMDVAENVADMYTLRLPTIIKTPRVVLGSVRFQVYFADSINESINQSIKIYIAPLQSIKIYIAPLQDTYSEALPTQAKRKRTEYRIAAKSDCEEMLFSNQDQS